MEAADELAGIVEEGVGEVDERAGYEGEAAVSELGGGGSTRVGPVPKREFPFHPSTCFSLE